MHQGDAGVWERYADIDRDSGVVAYMVTGDGIRVKFSDGSVYTYTRASASGRVDTLIRLARSGDGLNAYLSRYRPGYASKSHW